MALQLNTFTLPRSEVRLGAEKDQHDEHRIITRAVWRGGLVVLGNLLHVVTLENKRGANNPACRMFAGGCVAGKQAGPALSLKLNSARFKRFKTLSAVLTLPRDKNAVAAEQWSKEWHS